ncbi:MAG TPA: hypothetical protein VGR81_14045 [Candidatus Acidoferrales bacterium]|nr:hypothetical protein [Candidatus Acidoferrales bacterium]
MRDAAIVFSLFLLSAAPASSQQSYFPTDDFIGYRFDNSFTTEFYSRNLRALDEPSLWEVSQQDKQTVVYRFLWIRTFDHPVAVRVTIAPNNTGTVVVKMSDGFGEAGPGHLIKDESHTLPATEVADLIARIQRANFWDVPTVEPMKGTGLDGAEWVLEGVSSGNYHVVTRWSSQANGSYRKLCLFFVHDLAHLKIPRSRIY